MFSILAHNRRQGWQNFERITGETKAETVILSSSEPIKRPQLKTFKHDLARLCFMLFPLSFVFGKMFGKFWKCFKFWEKSDNHGKLEVMISIEEGKLWHRKGCNEVKFCFIKEIFCPLNSLFQHNSGVCWLFERVGWIKSRQSGGKRNNS